MENETKQKKIESPNQVPSAAVPTRRSFPIGHFDGTRFHGVVGFGFEVGLEPNLALPNLT